MTIRLTFVVCCAVFAAGAQAHEPAVSRYRVVEVQPPAAMQSRCVPGYVSGASITKINDFGLFNAVSNCFRKVDPVAPALEYLSSTFVGAPFIGSVELAHAPDTTSYSYTINNRGELFGYEAPSTGGLYAMRWTLAGGQERIFFDPACDTIQFQAAVDGNGKYIVGWGLRGDPSLPPPVDQLCIKSRWLFRNAAGVETTGPIGGEPSAINANDVAVGMVDRSAVRYHVPSAKLTVLHASDSAHSIEANEINDLGEIAGRIVTNGVPDYWNRCDPGVAVRWERDGRERVLPHLPGAVASHAWGVGYDGETVGDSGAGQYCTFTDNSLERATLWKGGRAYDLNSLIPRNSGITLTYAFSINRWGQITAGGFVNDEPLTLCPSIGYNQDPPGAFLQTVPCHNQHMFILNPIGR